MGEAIEVTYQAKGATTGLTDVVMEIYDESGAKDIVTFPDVTMTEIGATGRYYGSFTPDAVGQWKVLIDSVTESGKMVKQFDVVSHNIDSIGNAVDSVKTTVEGIKDRPILG
jgi:VCBS repeat-containing protein